MAGDFDISDDDYMRDMSGTYEDTGDTYPVCDTCGHIAPSWRLLDEPCRDCGRDGDDE